MGQRSFDWALYATLFIKYVTLGGEASELTLRVRYTEEGRGGSWMRYVFNFRIGA